MVQTANYHNNQCQGSPGWLLYLVSADMIFVKMVTLADFGPIIFYP